MGASDLSLSARGESHRALAGAVVSGLLFRTMRRDQIHSILEGAFNRHFRPGGALPVHLLASLPGASEHPRSSRPQRATDRGALANVASCYHITCRGQALRRRGLGGKPDATVLAVASGHLTSVGAAL